MLKNITAIALSLGLAFGSAQACTGISLESADQSQIVARTIEWGASVLKTDIVLIDEADIIDNNLYKKVIEHLYNANVRIGLSGTIYMSNLKKDLIHNMNIMSFIGDKVDQVKLYDQIKSGRATKVVVKIIPAQFKKVINDKLSYNEEYEDIIVNNIEAYKLSFSRALFNAQYNRYPMLIVCKYINHCEKLYKYYSEQNKLGNYGLVIKHVHHKTKGRDKILNEFRDNKIDILISTLIISRGQNFPSLRYIQNISSMDSQEKSIQILGRLVRKCEGKNKTYLDDFIFPGRYLKRHGNHRKNYKEFGGILKDAERSTCVLDIIQPENPVVRNSMPALYVCDYPVRCVEIAYYKKHKTYNKINESAKFFLHLFPQTL